MASQFEFTQKNVLLDIEGTTTSITFVKDVLFPYIRNHLEEYIQLHWSSEELQNVFALLKKQNAEDLVNGVEGVILIKDDDLKASIIKNVHWQMDLDRKTYALKKLQGFIWREGYSSGDLKSHLYPDALRAMQAWKAKGKDIYIYSSGSIEAQKLLFKYTIYGNLSEMISGYFDTNVGAKFYPESYSVIANTLDCKTSDILFLTDVIKEAEAAEQAGCKVFVSERPGNAPLKPEDRIKFFCIQSFDQLVAK